MSNETVLSIQKLVRDILSGLGEDPNRPGLQKTPQRTAEAYKKLLDGYTRSLKEEITVFDNDYEYDEIVYSGEIDFFSLCEHHMLPFFGKAYIGYIPGDNIIGLSKLARAVDIHSRKLQQQERLTTQIAADLSELMQPKGIIVMLQGKHFCNMARGVEQVNSTMKTIAAQGEFKQDEKLRSRFLQLVRSG